MKCGLTFLLGWQLLFTWNVGLFFYKSPHSRCLSLVILTVGTLDTSSNTSETSIMSFLSAMESRSLQAGPVSASLLPPFRPTSWPAGENTSSF